VGEVTRILHAVDSGDANAAEEVLPLVYEELRRLAVGRMSNEAPGQTLQPTALVHEAWLRLTEGENEELWESRAHFFGAAAEAMRRILIDNARRKKAQRHGGGQPHLDISELEIPGVAENDELLRVHEALDGRAKADRGAADLVKLRYFVGMNMREAATAMDIPLRTVERLWSYARAWLRRELKREC